MQDKTSFVCYASWKELFDALSDTDAGKLMKIILAYVNDENPEEPKSGKILIAWIIIKDQLKRDLKKWKKSISEKSESGTIGNLKRWHVDIYTDYKAGKIDLKKAVEIAESRKTSLSDNVRSQPVAKIAVTEDVDVNVDVNYTFRIRDKIFKEPLKGFVSKNYGSRIDAYIMHRPDKNLLPVVLDRMATDYAGYEFNNENHVWNSFKTTWQKVSKEPVQTPVGKTSYPKM